MANDQGRPAPIPGENPGQFQMSNVYGDKIEIGAPTHDGVVNARFCGFNDVKTEHVDGAAVLTAKLSPPGRFKNVSWKLYDWNWHEVMRDARKILFFELERETNAMIAADDPRRYQQIDIWIQEKQLVEKMDEVTYFIDYDNGVIEIRIPH